MSLNYQLSIINYQLYEVFGRKKKSKPEPDFSKLLVLPNDVAEYVQTQNGLTSSELLKLLDSLNRVNPAITITRQRPVKGKNYSKPVGGKQRKMIVADAIEYEKKRAEARLEKETKLKEIVDLDFDELLERQELNDEIYPKRLSPADIVRSTESAQTKLEEQDRQRALPRKIFMPREESILNVLTIVKKNEAARVAKQISEKQKDLVAGKTTEEIAAVYAAWLRKMKGEPEPETPEETAARLEQEAVQAEENEKTMEEARRELEGFGKDLHTLVDEAGELVSESPDAAAAVLGQWIGNIIPVKEN